MPPSASSASPKLRGRHWVILWLLVFLAVAVAVSARQTSGSVLAQNLDELRKDRRALEAERAALQRDVREATSRKVLGDRAEAELGMHQPPATEFTVLRLAPGDR